jgi:membrane associated rhomboid family serine protease
MARAENKFPAATLSILFITGIVTGLQFVYPQVLSGLQRTPTALANREWWRLMTPLLVQNEGWRQVAINFPGLLVIGTLTERVFGSARVLVMYLVCGFVGEIAGYAWQPSGAGSSVAIAGLLGALASYMVGERRPAPMRTGGVVILTGGLILTCFRDLHGPPVLAGACLAFVMSKGPRNC